MKNLRKLIAVVLVVAMAFTFVTIASAKFTDDASIKYPTAVGVMTGLGAIGGYPDGSFNPSGNVTRAEAAKMVTYALLGPTVAKSLTTTTSSFKDVPTTHWASAMIEYCVANGIINGRGDGTFDPNGSVTGFELAKMLLCAVGYGKNNEFTGANWALAVSSVAFTNNVFKGNESANFSAPATREEAALYIFNTVDGVQKVTYSKVTGEYTGVTTGVDPNKVAVTIGSSVYGLKNDIVMVLGNQATGMPAGKTAVAVAALYTTGANAGKVNTLTPGTTLNFSTGINDIGQMFKVYYSTFTTGTVYYSGIVSSQVMVFANITTAAKYATTFGSVATGVANNNYSFANYVGATNDVATKAALVVGAAANAGIYNMYAGQIVSFSAFADTALNKVTSIVTSPGAESISLVTGTLANQIGNDKVIEYTGIAVGDYVLATNLGGGAYSLTKAVTASGTLTGIGYVAANGPIPAYSTYTVGGTVYKASYTPDSSASSLTAPASMAIGTSYTLYLDATGAIIAAKGAALAPNYGFVAQYGLVPATINGFTTTSLGALIYFADGTSGTYVLDTTTAGTPYKDAEYDTGLTTKTTVVGINKVFTFVVNPVTKVATATAIANPLTSPGATGNATLDCADITVKAGSNLLATEGSNLYANDSSVVFYYTGAYGSLTTPLVVTPVIGNSKFVPATAPFSYAAYTDNVAGQHVLSVAIANSGSTATTPTLVYYAGNYTQSTETVNGVSVTTTTYSVYKNGEPTTVSYKDVGVGLKTAVGYYETGALNLTSAAAYNGTFILHDDAATTTTDLFGSTLYIDSKAVQIGSAKIIDLTGGTYTGLYGTGKTVDVFVDWTKTKDSNGADIYTANDIYVVNSTYTASATHADVTVNTVTAHMVLTSNVNNVATYTVTFSGTSSAASTITLTGGVWGTPSTTNLVRASNTVLTIANNTNSAGTCTFTVALTSASNPVIDLVITTTV